MRYFFDVAHGAHTVVSHALHGKVAVLLPRDNPLRPLSKSVSTAHILVKTTDWSKAANLASIVAAPFTGGTSLALNAALRAGTVGVAGARAGLAGKRAGLASEQLDQAKNALATAQRESATSLAGSNTPKYRAKPGTRKTAIAVGTGEQTQLSDYSDIGDVKQGAGSKLGETPKASNFGNIMERGTENLQAIDTSNPSPVDSELTGAFTSQSKFTDDVLAGYENQTIAEEHAKRMTAEHEKAEQKHDEAKEAYDKIQDENNPSMMAAGVGAYGMNVLENRKQQNQAKQQEEMQRIEQIAQAGREKSGTGGGQVAVTA